MKEWIVKYQCYTPLRQKPVAAADHFDDESALRDFCWDSPEDIIEVLEITRAPLGIKDVTDAYVPSVPLSRFEREEIRGERIAEMRREGVV